MYENKHICKFCVLEQGKKNVFLTIAIFSAETCHFILYCFLTDQLYIYILFKTKLDLTIGHKASSLERKKREKGLSCENSL